MSRNPTGVRVASGERILARQGRLVEADGRAVVRFDTGCGGCQARCRTSPPAFRDIPLADLAAELAEEAPRLGPGDDVFLEVTGRSLARVAGWVFGVPLVALLAGGLLGEALTSAPASTNGGADLTAAATGLAALVLAFAGTIARPETLVAMLKLSARRQGHAHEIS
jgi:positive regulator of sigma E activity